jgi:hypothetical protein
MAAPGAHSAPLPVYHRPLRGKKSSEKMTERPPRQGGVSTLGLLALVGSVCGAALAFHSARQAMRAEARAATASGTRSTPDLRLTADGTIDAYAGKDFNLTAGHVRLVSNDSNFEFENRGGASRLLSYMAGTAVRTPVLIGGAGDRENVTSLVVGAEAKQTADIVQFKKGDDILGAIDAKGGFRLDEVTFEFQRRAGGLILLATTSQGVRYRVRLVRVR